MDTLAVTISEELDDDLEAYLDAHPHYRDKSEVVRDALSRLITPEELSDSARDDIQESREQIKAGKIVRLDTFN